MRAALHYVAASANSARIRRCYLFILYKLRASKSRGLLLFRDLLRTLLVHPCTDR
jgi:hypothetical protein